jgi:6-phosphofructokinase 1
MAEFRKIGVLTSGGDAPGMNAAVRAVTRAAIYHGVKVMGIRRGYSGLIDGDISELKLRDVSNIINKGGTMLYSDRCPEMLTDSGKAKAIETCRRLEIDGIVAIGGDGTFRGARALTRLGIPCIGIPGTIDNDITSTDSSIGFDTAMNTVIEFVDRLRDTCESHARCNVVEVMGRGAGDIALNTAIATGAAAVVIPEIPYDDDEICKKIKESRKIGKRNFIVIVSEGVGTDYAPALTKKIQETTGVETKFARLAHVVRGGNPNLRDRILASAMGVAAVEQLLLGKSNLVMCERHGDIVATDIAYALTADKMNKKIVVTAEELSAFTEEEQAGMAALVEERQKDLERLYQIAKTINL